MSDNGNHPIMEGTGVTISGENNITSPTPFTTSTFTSRRKEVVEWKWQLTKSEMYKELTDGQPCEYHQLAIQPIQIWQYVKVVRYVTTTTVPPQHYPGVRPHNNNCHGGMEDGHEIQPDEGVCAHTHTEGPLPPSPPLDEGLGDDLGEVIPQGQQGNPVVVD